MANIGKPMRKIKVEPEPKRDPASKPKEQPEPKKTPARSNSG